MFSRLSCPISRSAPSADAVAASQRRSRWLSLLLKIHWMSSAICLLGMVLFSVTGITLNHATQIEAKPNIVRSQATLPPSFLNGLKQQAETGHVLPSEVRDWARREFRIDLAEARAEWSSEEIYFPLPKPGGDAWLRIDLESGEAEFEATDRGWISWLNDLHKGRHTGSAWSLFIDVFAIGCLLFSLSGLLILKMQAAQRHSTWPLVGLGVLIPALLALVFIH